MAKQDEVDPNLEVAQSVYDNLALPKDMFENRTHHYTAEQLQYLALLCKEVGLHYDAECDVEMDNQAPAATSLSHEVYPASTSFGPPQHQYMDPLNLEGSELFGAVSWESDVAGHLSVGGGEAILESSQATTQETLNDGHVPSQKAPSTSFPETQSDILVNGLAGTFCLSDSAAPTADSSSDAEPRNEAIEYYGGFANLFPPLDEKP